MKRSVYKNSHAWALGTIVTLFVAGKYGVADVALAIIVPISVVCFYSEIVQFHKYGKDPQMERISAWYGHRAARVFRIFLALVFVIGWVAITVHSVLTRIDI